MEDSVLILYPIYTALVLAGIFLVLYTIKGLIDYYKNREQLPRYDPSLNGMPPPYTESLESRSI